MPVLYFDTSALAKRYYRESGHRIVKRLTGNPANHIAFSNIGVIEVASVLQKKVRMGDMDRRTAKLRLCRFIYDSRSEYNTFSVDNRFLWKSMGLVQKYDLRTLDAIHLATAKYVNSQASNFQFISADSDLINAAKSDGMVCINLS